MRIILMATLLLGSGRAAWPQAPEVPAPAPAGAQIRVRLATDVVEHGRLLVPLDRRSAVVEYCRIPSIGCPTADSTGLRRRALGSVRLLEIREGNRTGRGALLGGGIAAGVLGLGLLLWNDADSPVQWNGARVAGAISFVALGTSIGALIGRGHGRWRPIYPAANR